MDQETVLTTTTTTDAAGISLRSECSGLQGTELRGLLSRLCLR
ncbi:MAG: hypothetical protein ACRDWV_01835 [Acidimicrobiales bacterium]